MINQFSTYYPKFIELTYPVVVQGRKCWKAVESAMTPLYQSSCQKVVETLFTLSPALRSYQYQIDPIIKTIPHSLLIFAALTTLPLSTLALATLSFTAVVLISDPFLTPQGQSKLWHSMSGGILLHTASKVVLALFSLSPMMAVGTGIFGCFIAGCCHVAAVTDESRAHTCPPTL